MSLGLNWPETTSESDLWMGDVLVQGLSDSLSEQFARMRCVVRPSELLGAYSSEGSSLPLQRRLLLCWSAPMLRMPVGAVGWWGRYAAQWP